VLYWSPQEEEGEREREEKKKYIRKHKFRWKKRF
jgi:hypothetical protein